jgi:DNA-binding MarR family transcriptional regulator
MLAATSIARAHQIVVGAVDAALGPFGLSFARFEILALLCFSRHGALPMGKIGDRLQVHPTSVTSAVARLERDGLVRRVPSDRDRRTVLAELTPDGRDAVSAAAAALTASRFGLAGLDDGELDAVRDALAVVRRAAGDTVAPPATGGRGRHRVGSRR